MNKVFLVLAVAALFGYGSALKCYQCDDNPDSKLKPCAGFEKNSTFEQTCAAGEDVCGKGVFKNKAANITMILRGCANQTVKEEECKKLSNNQVEVNCYFCKKDLCNTAAIPTSVSSLVYILPIALFLFTVSSK